MLVAGAKHLAISEPGVNSSSFFGTISPAGQVVTVVEPCNKVRIAKFVKVATTPLVSWSQLPGPVNGEASRNRDEVVVPGFNIASNNRSESVPSTRAIGSVSRSAMLYKQGRVGDRLIGIGMGEQNALTASVLGGDEDEDLGNTQLAISKPGSIVTSQARQSLVEQNAAPPDTSTNNGNEDLDPTEVFNQMTNEAGSLASTRIIESRPSSVHAREGPESTSIIDSRPSSPVVLSPGRAAFGTWALDAEVQDAPSFTFPEFSDNVSLASTLIINY